MKIGKIGQAIPWLFILTGVFFLTFSPCLKNGFVQWDEDRYLLENTQIRDFSPSGIAQLFDPHVNGIYIPLTLLTYSIEYHFCKYSPQIYHLDNIILHLFNGFLVFWLVYLLSSKMEVAFIAAALFGVSPLRVESVAWVMERKDVLYSFFYLAALISYIRFIKNPFAGYFLGSLFLFICSLLAKPQAITFPLIMLAADYYCKRAWSWPLCWRKLPFGLLSTVFLGISMVGIQHLYDPSQDPRFYFSGGYILLLYFIKSFIPFHLSCINPVPRQADLYSLLMVSSSMIIVLSTGWFVARRCAKDKVTVFGFLFYTVLMVLPILNSRYSDGGFYEHYTYLPSVGLYFIFAAVFVKWIDRPRSNRFKPGAILLLGGYLLVNAVMSFERCGIWKDALTLWSNVIENSERIKTISPSFALAYNNRGLSHYNQGKIAQAVADYNKAIGIDPTYAKAYINRGLVYYDQDKLFQAISDFNKAIEINPFIPMAYNDRALVYFKQNNFPLAFSDFNKAIEIDPDFEISYNNRGWAYFSKGQLSRAYADFNKAIELNPYYAKAYLNRGWAYYSQGQLSQAIADYNKTIELDPFHEKAYLDRGLAFYDQGKFSKSIDDYNETIRQAPGLRWHITIADWRTIIRARYSGPSQIMTKPLNWTLSCHGL